MTSGAFVAWRLLIVIAVSVLVRCGLLVAGSSGAPPLLIQAGVTVDSGPPYDVGDCSTPGTCNLRAAWARCMEEGPERSCIVVLAEGSVHEVDVPSFGALVIQNGSNIVIDGNGARIVPTAPPVEGSEVRDPLVLVTDNAGQEAFPLHLTIANVTIEGFPAPSTDRGTILDIDSVHHNPMRFIISNVTFLSNMGGRQGLMSSISPDFRNATMHISNTVFANTSYLPDLSVAYAGILYFQNLGRIIVENCTLLGNGLNAFEEYDAYFWELMSFVFDGDQYVTISGLVVANQSSAMSVSNNRLDTRISGVDVSYLVPHDAMYLDLVFRVLSSSHITISDVYIHDSMDHYFDTILLMSYSNDIHIFNVRISRLHSYSSSPYKASKPLQGVLVLASCQSIRIEDVDSSHLTYASGGDYLVETVPPVVMFVENNDNAVVDSIRCQQSSMVCVVVHTNNSNMRISNIYARAMRTAPNYMMTWSAMHFETTNRNVSVDAFTVIDSDIGAIRVTSNNDEIVFTNIFFKEIHYIAAVRIFASNTNFEFRNMTIEDCRAIHMHDSYLTRSAGVSVVQRNENFTFVHCNFARNVIEQGNGGAVHIGRWNSWFVFKGCRFIGNVAEGGGGGAIAVLDNNKHIHITDVEPEAVRVHIREDKVISGGENITELLLFMDQEKSYVPMFVRFAVVQRHANGSHVFLGAKDLSPGDLPGLNFEPFSVLANTVEGFDGDFVFQTENYYSFHPTTLMYVYVLKVAKQSAYSEDHNYFFGNYAGMEGGAIFFRDRNAYVSLFNAHCEGNVAVSTTGGCMHMGNGNSFVYIQNVLMEGNIAESATAGGGGALNIETSNNLVRIADAVFRNNQAGLDGGAIRMGSKNGDSLFIEFNYIFLTRVEMFENTALRHGGGISLGDLNWLYASGLRIFNSSSTNGGGIYASSLNGVVIESTYIYGCEALSAGGGMYFGTNTTANLFFVSVEASRAASIGGAVVAVQSELLCSGDILFGPRWGCHRSL